MMDDEITADGVRELSSVFDDRITVTREELYKFGLDLGYNKVQIAEMLEVLLDFGYIHEPIQGSFKFIREVK